MPGVGSTARPRPCGSPRWPRRRARMRAAGWAVLQQRRSRDLRALQRIAEESGLPQCIYNIPGARARISNRRRSPPGGTCRTSRMSRRRPARSTRRRAILTTTDLTFLSGDDSLTLPLMAIRRPRRHFRRREHRAQGHAGADCPPPTARHGRRTKTGPRSCSPLCRDMLGLSTNPIPIKAAMKMLGRDSGEMRLPMTPLEASQETMLRKTSPRYGLL